MSTRSIVRNGSIDAYLDRYLAAGLSGAGARPQEIAELEAWLGHALPAAYRAWLLLVGKLPPPQLIGSHCEFHRLRELQTWAADLLEEEGRTFRLPDPSFVFLMHQGYYFAYFPLDGSDDPPVYSWQEGQGRERDAAPTKAADRFSLWAMGVVAGLQSVSYDDTEWTREEMTRAAERMFDDLDSAERIP